MPPFYFPTNEVFLRPVPSLRVAAKNKLCLQVVFGGNYSQYCSKHLLRGARGSSSAVSHPSAFESSDSRNMKASLARLSSLVLSSRRRSGVGWWWCLKKQPINSVEIKR